MENQAFAAPLVTDALVSGLDLMHEPEVYRKLVGQYPMQRDLTFLQMLGQYEKVEQTTFNWHEENRIMNPVTIKTKSTVNATTVRIVLAAEDHYDSGKYSFIRKNDRVEFKNGAQGVVIDKNTSTPGAHYVDIIRVNEEYDVVAAAVIGDQLGIFSMAFEEGGGGYEETILPRTTPFSNKVQIFREDAKVTSSEETNKTWLEFKVPEGYPNAGEVRGFYFAKVLADTYDRFNLKEAIGLLTNDIDNGNVLVTGNDRPSRLTRGFIPHVKKYANIMDYVNKPTMGTFHNMTRIINKNYGEKQNMLLMGLDFSIGLTDFASDFAKNGSVIYNQSNGKQMDALSLGFTTYKFPSGYEFFTKEMQSLNYADATGLAGFKYKELAILSPMDGRKDENNGGKIMKPLCIRYKKQLGKGAQEMHKVWWTGGASEGGTDDKLVNRVHLASEKGMQVYGAKRFIYIAPSS